MGTTMAGTKNHDYHILPPSPWPMLSSFAALVLAVGGIMYMRDAAYGGLVFGAGLIATLACMGFWWADVIRESKAGDHTPVVRIGLQYGFILFIISEVMFFAAWFWAFFKNALYPMGPESPIKDGVWPPEGITTFDPWHLPLLNTLILLCSGTTITWAHHALLDGDRLVGVFDLDSPVPDRFGADDQAGLEAIAEAFIATLD